MGQKKHTKKKRKKSTLKIVLLSILFIILSIGVVGSAVVLGMIKTAPEIDIRMITSFDEPTKFFDDQGKLIDEYLTVEKREPVEFKDIPKNLVNAFVSIEDERFFKHKGLDYKRLGGATLSNIKNLVTGKRSFQGGSTITQQLIKQRYFLTQSLHNRLSIERKIQEMYLATKLEKKLSKNKILETYLNTIPLGGTAYGVKSAAKQYFNKELKDLSLTECAFIASCAQSPSVSYGAAKYAFDKKEIHNSPRTAAILKKMLQNNSISKQEYNKVAKPQLKYSFNSNFRNKMNYEWFSRPVIEQVIKDLKSTYNYTDSEINSLLNYGGLKIYTTMNTNLQNKAQAIIDENVTKDKPYAHQYIFPRKGNLEPIQPKLQASATIMDYHTGEVKVIIGGRGEQGPLSYNRAASSKFLRPPGSAIKPLTVFAPAIDTKLATAGTVIEDSPLSNELAKSLGTKDKPYNPKNASKKYYGYVPLRTIVKNSLNISTVKLTYSLGLNIAASYGEKFGLQIDDVDKRSIAALALGQLDAGQYSGTNPLTISASYGAFGNKGIVVNPRIYKTVMDRTGKVILETKPESKKVISPQTAYIMYDLLKGPVSPGGTAPSANFGNIDVRGKTGTSSDSKDAWFAGLTPYYSGAVWVGNDDSTEIRGSFYSNNVGKLWGKLMAEAHINLSNKQISKPEGIVETNICMDSGTLPSELSYKDPRGSRVYKELFIKGTEPTTYDNIHVLAQVVKSSNGKYVLAGPNSAPGTIENRVFIRRNYKPSVPLSDEMYVLPTQTDNSISKPEAVTKEKDKKEKEEEEEKNKDKIKKDSNSKENKDKKNLLDKIIEKKQKDNTKDKKSNN